MSRSGRSPARASPASRSAMSARRLARPVSTSVCAAASSDRRCARSRARPTAVRSSASTAMAIGTGPGVGQQRRRRRGGAHDDDPVVGVAGDGSGSAAWPPDGRRGGPWGPRVAARQRGEAPVAGHAERAADALRPAAVDDHTPRAPVDHAHLVAGAAAPQRAAEALHGDLEVDDRARAPVGARRDRRVGDDPLAGVGRDVGLGQVDLALAAGERGGEERGAAPPGWRGPTAWPRRRAPPAPPRCPCGR